MATVVTSSGRKSGTTDGEVAALFRGLSAYTGRFRIEQDRVVTKVDAAWEPSWENTEQLRYYVLDGDKLTLTTDPLNHPAFPGRRFRGIVVWVREV